jgi:hypothetical protein
MVFGLFVMTVGTILAVRAVRSNKHFGICTYLYNYVGCAELLEQIDKI